MLFLNTLGHRSVHSAPKMRKLFLKNLGPNLKFMQLSVTFTLVALAIFLIAGIRKLLIIDSKLQNRTGILSKWKKIVKILFGLNSLKAIALIIVSNSGCYKKYLNRNKPFNSAV